MRVIKIALALGFIALIGFFVWKWSGFGTSEIRKIRPPTNQFTERIEREIDSLKKAPTNVFCKEFYDGIHYRITDYHRQNFFSKNENENNQWKEILLKNLYSAYAPAFAEEAFYVFKGSAWEIVDLKFISEEVIRLKSSIYLERGSNIDNRFGEIATVLSKYYEIAGFLSSCHSFLFSHFSLHDLYPVNEISKKIQRSKAYIRNGLDNSYVNNCSRLKSGLGEIPKILFNKHVNYLHSKIQQNIGRYVEYKYQSDYSRVIYTPLKSQIESLDNDIYGINNDIFDYNSNSLEKFLNDDNNKAMEYFRKRNN